MESSKTIITLKTSDEELFEVEKSVAMEMVTVKNFFDEDDDDSSSMSKLTIIPVPAVSSESLSMIITYIDKHLQLKAIGADEGAKKAYDARFMEQASKHGLLLELILAANYLDVQYLLDKLNDAVAKLIENKSVEFVRDFFGIQNDFTSEEEAKIRQDHIWAFKDVDKD
ncbi:SKP1-like protein 1 [Ricinus communis]|uniref:SKP1-like protein 1 n=1 Tax=Ricinus communis TaxID=3988 RepID=UPI00201A7616|nr:SKP1-like protein 1 [Ricinus communis]